jgi:hypothetical protein
LVSATRAAIASVSFRAATGSGWVIQYRKPETPSPRDAQISAAIGSATTTVRNVVTKPRERAVAAPSLARVVRSA